MRPKRYLLGRIVVALLRALSRVLLKLQIKGMSGTFIAPEGTRSGHGRLQEAHAGVTLVLLRTGTDIPTYPVAHVGLELFGPP